MTIPVKTIDGKIRCTGLPSEKSGDSNPYEIDVLFPKDRILGEEYAGQFIRGVMKFSTRAEAVAWIEGK